MEKLTRVPTRLAADATIGSGRGLDGEDAGANGNVTAQPTYTDDDDDDSGDEENDVDMDDDASAIRETATSIPAKPACA